MNLNCTGVQVLLFIVVGLVFSFSDRVGEATFTGFHRMSLRYTYISLFVNVSGEITLMNNNDN